MELVLLTVNPSHTYDTVHIMAIGHYSMGAAYATFFYYT